MEEWTGIIVVCLGSIWWSWISTKISGSELQFSFEGVCQDPECPVFSEGSQAFCAPDVWCCVMELRSACMNRALLFKHSYSELAVPWRFFLPSFHQPWDDEAVAWGTYLCCVYFMLRVCICTLLISSFFSLLHPDSLQCATSDYLACAVEWRCACWQFVCAYSRCVRTVFLICAGQLLPAVSLWSLVLELILLPSCACWNLCFEDVLLRIHPLTWFAPRLFSWLFQDFSLVALLTWSVLQFLLTWGARIWWEAAVKLWQRSQGLWMELAALVLQWARWGYKGKRAMGMRRRVCCGYRC